MFTVTLPSNVLLIYIQFNTLKKKLVSVIKQAPSYGAVKV